MYIRNDGVEQKRTSGLFIVDDCECRGFTYLIFYVGDNFGASGAGMRQSQVRKDEPGGATRRGWRPDQRQCQFAIRVSGGDELRVQVMGDLFRRIILV